MATSSITESFYCDDPNWYNANLDTLLPKYRGRYVAICDGRVVGDYPDFNEGVEYYITS